MVHDSKRFFSEVSSEKHELWTSKTFSRVSSDVDPSSGINSKDSVSIEINAFRRNRPNEQEKPTTTKNMAPLMETSDTLPYFADIATVRKDELHPLHSIDASTITSVGDLEETSDTSENEQHPLLIPCKTEKYPRNQQVTQNHHHCRKIDTFEFDEIDLEEGEHDTPDVLCKFEDDVHCQERCLSYGQTLLSCSGVPKADDLQKAETILSNTYRHISFLLKQNERLASGLIVGTRTLSLRVARCEALARLYFALNRRIMCVREGERDYMLSRIRAWASALDGDVAQRMDEIDIRSGVPDCFCSDLNLIARVWDTRIVPFNERVRQLSRKISEFDERCVLLAKLVERQQNVQAYTDRDNLRHLKMQVTRLVQDRYRNSMHQSLIMPMKVLAVVFILGVSLNMVF